MADEPLEDDLAGAQVIAFPGDDGELHTVSLGELDAEGREKLRWEGARRKAVFVHRVNGAQLRSAMLPRELMRGFADGTATLLFARILQGEIEPRDAKEAAEVARIAYDIARKEEANAPLAETAKEVVTDRSSAERAARELAEELRARQAQAAALPDAPFGDDPTDTDEWAHDEQVPDGDGGGGYDPDGSKPSEE